MGRLSRDEIVHALNALGHELSGQATPVELAVLGGAALVLLYDARDSTKDVDAIVIDTAHAAAVRAAASRVGAALGLPSDWLNDAAKGYLHGLALGEVVHDSSGLTVRALAPQQLLAMKLSAWRDDVDIEDARLLLSHLAGTREAIWGAVEPHLVPGRELKARYAFDDLWEAQHGAS